MKLYLFCLVFCFYISQFSVKCQNNAANITVPLGGNAYVTKKGSSKSTAAITDDGLVLWNNAKTVISVYFKLFKAEKYNVALQLSVPSGKSSIMVSVNGGKSYKTQVTGTDFHAQNIGSFTAKSAGYVKLDLQGITKSGTYFAKVSDVILSNIKGNVSFIALQDEFYYGRRGPSVHFNWIPSSEEKLEYFYNEVTVPTGSDKVGCYFMANGFSDGYFGIQRTDENTKRVLFSVFSDYKTDDPSKVPEEFKVKQVRKGNNVTVTDFGNEGSGLKSFLEPYDWKTEVTYQFLIRGKPKAKSNSSVFTGWFRAPGSDWQLISSLLKPKAQPVYLTNLYSFSENFEEDQGWLARKAYYGNQWSRNHAGKWTEVVDGYFTDDATGMHGREDYEGGITKDKKRFYLRNCGFFNEHVSTAQTFTRLAGNVPPIVDFDSLP